MKGGGDMSGEVRRFRRKLFGGFDTCDVMRYIEELASQRNQYKLSGDKLGTELQQFKSEIAALREQLSDADRRVSELSFHSIEDASVSVEALKDTYTGIRTEMEAISSIIGAELDRLSGTLTNLSNAFEQTDTRLGEITSAIEQEKEDLLHAHSSEAKQ